MEIKKEVLPKSHVKLNIKVSSPEMRGFFSRVYNKMAPQAQVKGFRPGMAPKSMTISAIGESRLNSEIIDLALQETYTAALKKENLVPVSQPKVNIKMLKDLTVDTAELEYEAEFDVLPQVKLGDYKNLKIAKKQEKEIKVTDEEVERVISHLRRQKATFKDISRPLKTGDRAEINFEGYERGVKLENLSSQHYPVILGAGALLPDFEKNLIELKKGEKKDFTIEMAEPKDKNAKKHIDFKVEVLETQEVILPADDEALAKDFQKETFKDLQKAIKDDIISEKKVAQHKAVENEVLEGLLKITETEIPEGLIEQEVERQVNDIRGRVAAMGLTLEKYLENLKKTPEEFKSDLRLQAEKTIKIGLALGEVVKMEKMDPKDKEAGKIALEKLIKYNIK